MHIVATRRRDFMFPFCSWYANSCPCRFASSGRVLPGAFRAARRHYARGCPPQPKIAPAAFAGAIFLGRRAKAELRIRPAVCLTEPQPTLSTSRPVRDRRSSGISGANATRNQPGHCPNFSIECLVAIGCHTVRLQDDSLAEINLAMVAPSSSMVRFRGRSAGAGSGTSNPNFAADIKTTRFAAASRQPPGLERARGRPRQRAADQKAREPSQGRPASGARRQPGMQ